MNEGRSRKGRRLVLEQPRTRKRVIALLLEGVQPVEIAREMGVTQGAITYFKRRHAAELGIAVEKIERQIEDAAIAHVVNRVWDAQGDYDRLGAVIDARAQDTRYAEPGYATGLMVHQLKSLGGGENTQIVDEYKVDTTLISERRMLRREVAEVLDQLPRSDANKVDVNVAVGVVLKWDDGERA